MEILTNSSSVAVQDCECRAHYQRCDKPLEVCFLLNKVGDHLASKDKARRVALTEAANILKKANENSFLSILLYTCLTVKSLHCAAAVLVVAMNCR